MSRALFPSTTPTHQHRVGACGCDRVGRQGGGQLYLIRRDTLPDVEQPVSLVMHPHPASALRVGNQSEALGSGGRVRLGEMPFHCRGTRPKCAGPAVGDLQRT